MSTSLHALLESKQWGKSIEAIRAASLEELSSYGWNNWTPLHLACSKKAPVQVIQLLLEKGVDVNVKHESNWTALHYACFNQDATEAADTVRVLLESGAEVNARIPDSLNTPLQLACMSRPTALLVHVLIEGGARVNDLDKANCSALHYALNVLACQDVVQLLLNAGACTTSMNNEGRLPFYYAANAELQELISDHSTTPASVKKPVSLHRPSISISPIFVDLFTKAGIADLNKQHDYMAKLSSESIDTCEILLALSDQDWKTIGIGLEDAVRLNKAAQDMLNYQGAHVLNHAAAQDMQLVNLQGAPQVDTVMYDEPDPQQRVDIIEASRLAHAHRWGFRPCCICVF